MAHDGNLTFTDGLTPGDLGLPDKFDGWRPGQQLAIERTLNNDRRFIAHASPTGTGKSLVYVASSLYQGGRSAFLTSTKGLQDQLEADFEVCGLKSARGKQNFQCVARPGWTCEQGAHADCSCHRNDSGCPYRTQYNEACAASLVSTNYAYWAAINKYGEGMGTFDMLVLDEAHDCPDVVSSINSATLTDEEVLGVLGSQWPKQPLFLAGWSPWAQPLLRRAEGMYQKAVQAARRSGAIQDVKKAAGLQSLVTKLQAACNVTNDWVVEQVVRRSGRHEGTEGWKLEPVWPAKYAEKTLFLGIPKIVLASATLSRATLRLLGIGPSEYSYYEYGSPFPPELSPVYQIPTVKLNHKSGPEDYFLLIERVDEIIDGRLDRKGIIHTTSYERASKIIEGSRHSAHFLTHTNRPGDAMRTYHQFRSMPAPAILVSPSVTTGYDFPADACEYQIMVKAPYPDLRSKVMRRRMDVDRNYPAYIMAESLVQACGRGTRSRTDQCENFILDDVVANVINRQPDLFPAWWKKLYRNVDRVPEAPPPLCV